MANEDGGNGSNSATNGTSSPRENGNNGEKNNIKKEFPSHSPHSSISSNSSTPSSKHKEVSYFYTSWLILMLTYWCLYRRKSRLLLYPKQLPLTVLLARILFRKLPSALLDIHTHRCTEAPHHMLFLLTLVPLLQLLPVFTHKWVCHIICLQA